VGGETGLAGSLEEEMAVELGMVERKAVQEEATGFEGWGLEDWDRAGREAEEQLGA
jgi:hypothetical protein